MNKKVVTFTVAMVLLLGITIGVTLAVLMDQTETLTNVFVAGDVGDLDLKETTGRQYIVVPGETATKDPVVEFISSNVPAYVYVMIPDGWDVSGNSVSKELTDGTTTISNAITFVVDTSWTPVTGVEGLFYIPSETFVEDADKTIPFISGNTITYSDQLTQDFLETFSNTNVATLPLTAYAVQQAPYNDPAAAWNATFGA